MRRFVVRHNIDRFESQLASATDPQDRLFLQSLIDDARHELAGLAQTLEFRQGWEKKGRKFLITPSRLIRPTSGLCKYGMI